jgi:hypothetical protein
MGAFDTCLQQRNDIQSQYIPVLPWPILLQILYIQQCFRLSPADISPKVMQSIARQLVDHFFPLILFFCTYLFSVCESRWR